MQKVGDSLKFSPSDLITFMQSPFASYMERKRLDDPSINDLMDEEDTVLKSLQEKGYKHEDEFLEELKNEFENVVTIDRASPEIMLAKTREAMAAGADVIAQAYLSHENFAGLSDFLVKVPGASNLGDYHYEVWDTKLSKKMKPYFAIQLSCYAEMLEVEQGVRPSNVAVVLGDKSKAYIKTHEVYSYYQALKRSFLEFHDTTDPDMPLPDLSLENGRWSGYGEQILKEQDHLCFVANITKTQIKRLHEAGIHTLTELSQTDLERVSKVNDDVFQRLKAQAEIQLQSEGHEKPEFRVLPHQPHEAKGLALLPPHSDGDIFFDIEGFPLMEGGLEYLWGLTYFQGDERTFKDYWAHDHEEEKKAFTAFIMWVYERWKQYPDMHVYHYAPYEITAIRKLMGKYGVCEYEVDNLLRNNVFVDLYKVVRHGLLIGETSYSIKNVEHIYRGKRDTEVANGADSVIVYEEWQNNRDGDDWTTSKVLKSIRDYNIDDCDSTQELTDWLRGLQAEHGIAFTGPKSEGEKELNEEETAITIYRDELLAKSDAEPDADKRELLRNLAWMLEFHRRENKPVWWKLFDRMGLNELELFDDMECLVGLVRTGTAPFKPTPKARNLAYEYAFDKNQPFKGQPKEFYILGEDDQKITCLSIDLENGTAVFQNKEAPPDRMSVIPNDFVRPAPIPDRIEEVVKQIVDNDFAPNAITDFLLRRSPRFVDGSRSPIVEEGLGGDEFLSAVIDAVVNLDNSTLCIQGPPGAGKTYTAKHIIGDLLKAGKRVGISSNSHKAILNLMKGVSGYIRDEQISAKLIKVQANVKDPELAEYGLVPKKSAKDCLDDVTGGAVCIGGTAWAFSNAVFVSEDEGNEPFDYLFIDEAGQVSLANLIAMSHACKNIVLMGDQMQLGQPLQGSHPDESGLSILDYLLQDHATIPADLGVFLPKTYRMNPAICDFISEHVYESRLHANGSTEKYRLGDITGAITRSSGILYIPVEHEGNSQGSEEEVAVIKQIVSDLQKATLWSAENKLPENVSLNDILFVAPYNYQVNLLRAELGDDAKIGSVDKFQGQEAPVVIISMCASSAAESPRGMEFLFSKNRLNVALSRAQALAIVVGSPDLAHTPANSIEQMKMVNFFSAIAEN